MAITTVLFDLDGTLLPMDQDIFIKTYFGKLSAKLASHGYDPAELIKTIWNGTMMMIKNSGDKTNEQVFWDYAESCCGEKILQDKYLFDEFYETQFDSIKEVCGHTPLAAETVHLLKSRGYRVILATNPIFPSLATEWRIGWAGLTPDDFELITTYENINYSKPNPEYYREIMRRFDLAPDECLMVGNDVSDDMVASDVGMKVFLLTDCLINNDNVDISIYPHGGFDKLQEYISTNL